VVSCCKVLFLTYYNAKVGTFYCIVLALTIICVFIKEAREIIRNSSVAKIGGEIAESGQLEKGYKGDAEF